MFSTAAAALTGSPATTLAARSGQPSPATSSASSRPALRPSPFLSAVGKGSGALALAALVSLAGGRPASAAFLSSPAPNNQQRSCSMATAATASASGPDTDNPGPGLEFAEFGAGCFWGVELAFQRIPGVLKTEVGYTQGSLDNPTYEQVCSGRSGHVEAVRVVYDPKEVSYDTLLDVLWARHDPTTLNRQGGDVGTQYRSGIYYFSPEQEQVARASLERRQAEIGRKIVTEIVPAKKWYRAEEYHQQYLAKGGRFGLRQSPAKGCNDPIRCYG